MHGSQTPTYSWCGTWTRTEGRLAAVMANTYGMPPHPWQRLILDDWLALDDSGRLLNSLCVLPVPRQNGKTGVCDPRETWGLVRRGEAILHTAQEYQTAKKAFDRLREKFGDRRNDPNAKFPELNALVRRYTTSANQMVLDLTNGAHIEFRTRGANSDMGRGGTFDLVVIDEAQSYTDEQDAALSPLNSAAPTGSPQTILMGTVPDPMRAYKGMKFASIRSGLHTEPYIGACIHEWGAPEIGDVMDSARWYEYNPSLGYQLLESALEKDARSMTPDAFAREHLGWWSPVDVENILITPTAWKAAEVAGTPSEYKKLAYGVRFTPDGRSVALSVAVIAGKVCHVEFIRTEPTIAGIGWLVDWIVARVDKTAAVGIDGRADATDLGQRLVEAGAPKSMVMVAKTSDAIAADAMLVNAVNDGCLTHLDDQALTDSALGATRRPIGRDGGFGFGGDYAERIDSCALALWAARTTKRDPSRKGKVGC